MDIAYIYTWRRVSEKEALVLVENKAFFQNNVLYTPSIFIHSKWIQVLYIKKLSF